MSKDLCKLSKTKTKTKTKTGHVKAAGTAAVKMGCEIVIGIQGSTALPS